MAKKQNRIPLKDLNLTDRFLFDEVMEDPQAYQDVLSIIFGRDILLLGPNETEKELRVSPLIRSIRMDVVSMDEENVLYNTEMQDKRKNDLAKRSRYYQALVDTNLLEPGIPNYNLLNTTYIILITTFDIFGYGKYRYTFRAVSDEVPECSLDDKATRIKRIHDRVCRVKLSEKTGVKYMQAWEEKYYEREEGFKEGCEYNLKQLVKKKLARGKAVEEIADAMEESTERIEMLMKEMELEDF